MIPAQRAVLTAMSETEPRTVAHLGDIAFRGPDRRLRALDEIFPLADAGLAVSCGGTPVSRLAAAGRGWCRTPEGTAALGGGDE